MGRCDAANASIAAVRMAQTGVQGSVIGLPI